MTKLPSRYVFFEQLGLGPIDMSTLKITLKIDFSFVAKNVRTMKLRRNDKIDENEGIDGHTVFLRNRLLSSNVLGTCLSGYLRNNPT